MRRVYAVLIALAALATTSVPPAQAEAIFERQVGQWRLAAHTERNSRAFSYCMIDTRYKSGTRLALWMTYDDIFSMGIFDLPPDRAWAKVSEVHYRFDDHPPRVATETSNGATHLIAKLPEDLDFMTQVNDARALRVATDAGNLALNLTDLGPAFEAMLACLLEMSATRTKS